MIERNQVIEYMETDAYRPLTVQELCEAFEIEGSDDFKSFMKLLNQMEEEGEIVRTRTNRYGVPNRMNLVVGRLQMKARGFGFLIPETPGDPDLYIPASDMNGAMSGDKVMARVEKAASGPRREGKIIRVLERAANRVVGKFTRYRDHAFVTPTDKRFPQDIFVSTEDMLDAHDGYIVVVEITGFPTATRGPEGKVLEVLGHPDAPGIDILTLIRKYGLPETFPDDVLAAAEEIPLELSERDYAGRRDLRHEVIVTIDGEDAKDLDDAVHVKILTNGNYLLGVHIADVGYYVTENGPIDKEAFKRGTSVYLVDRVIPMIPQRLSNNICSLNPKVDRLTLSCEMEISPKGEVVAHEIFTSVIRTTERMTYTNVRKIVQDEDPAVTERYLDLVPVFKRMEELALILRSQRMGRGAIDFDFDEVKVLVDDLGHPTDIVPRQRSIAERIIEEFMLVANETVAEHFHWLNAPFIYRIHDEPTLERMMDFNEFIHNFGYHLKGLGNKVHPRSLQDILKKAEGTREERVISTLMLRSMKQARYAPECSGHFGLAAEYYTHFTSPIRRYPDLMIHRIIREYLEGEVSEGRESRLRERVADASLQSSERERVAQDAERECDQLKMVEYMLEHIGEEYDGIISGVTQFGLFVQLENGVEGLIHVSYLADDYYVFNDKQMALVGERTRRVFRLGDPIRVRVAGASKEDLTIDFELVTHHREGTMAYESGVETVIYDEDLSPRDRKKQIALRAERATERRRPRGRGEDFGSTPGSRRGGGHGRDDAGRRGQRESAVSSARGSREGGGNGRRKLDERDRYVIGEDNVIDFVPAERSRKHAQGTKVSSASGLDKREGSAIGDGELEAPVTRGRQGDSGAARGGSGSRGRLAAGTASRGTAGTSGSAGPAKKGRNSGFAKGGVEAGKKARSKARGR